MIVYEGHSSVVIKIGVRRTLNQSFHIAMEDDKVVDSKHNIIDYRGFEANN